mmetsp:Transcript_99587/g.145540  ORF Transcript_99587/g.145540 Transcript_99587/m.145540 type:complete len:219 (+) Transcript_99587:333-989(+)
MLAPHAIDLAEDFKEAVTVHRPIHNPRGGLLSLALPKGPTHHTHCRHRKHKEGNGMYGVLVNRIAVALPHSVFEFAGRKKGTCSTRVEARSLGGGEDIGTVRRTFAVLKVCRIERVHKLLALAVPTRPQQHALRVHWLPVGLLVKSEFDPRRRTERREASLGSAGALVGAVCVVLETIVPRPTAAEEAATFAVAEEGIRMARDVDGQGYTGIGRVKTL